MTKFTYDENIFSDLYKDAHGFRPRGHEFYTASPERKQEIWDATIDALSEEIKREEQMQALASAKFEDMIAQMGELGAEDLTTAIRWIFQGEGVSDHDAMYGASYICWKFGLSYQHGLVPVFDLVLKQMYPTQEVA